MTMRWSLNARISRLVRIVSDIVLVAIIACWCSAAPAADGAAKDRTPATETSDKRDDNSPWGVATGSEWLSAHPLFNPILKRGGVRWLRSFHEWQVIQPRPGVWNWTLMDRLVADAKANGIHLSPVFAYLTSWASADGGTRRFPIKDMDYWRTYVSALVARYKEDIKYWEVWNEFNGSFSEGGSPEIYAQLVREAYAAAKKIDPSAQIGISVANFDVGFIENAIKAGAADHFDYVCVHPYEKAGQLGQGGEVDYFRMARTLRQMLAQNHQRADMPLWITEVGYTAPVRADVVGDRQQAAVLVKSYVLALASGFSKIFWFEARGPSYGDQRDHGLIRSDFSLRPSYQALKTLEEILGSEPKYIGWLDMGSGAYGFVFDSGLQKVLVAWSSAAQAQAISLAGDALVQDMEGGSAPLGPNGELTLAREPVLVRNLPAGLLAQAVANGARPPPWDQANLEQSSVSIGFGAESADRPVRLVNADTTELVKTDRETWRNTNFLKPDREGHYVYFWVDQIFVPFGTRKLEITATVKRRSREKPAGVGLTYESSKGYVDIDYQSIPDVDGWVDLTWRISDANFVSAWGWNFRLNGIASPGEFSVKNITVRKF